jgi:MYXO-CTERM domain-containing protein
MSLLRRTGLFAFPLLTLLALPRTASAAKYFSEVVNALGTQPCNGGGCYTNYLIVVDIDNDDKLDILVPNSGSGSQPLVVYKNNGDATFQNVSASAVNDLTGSFRVVAVADITGDGFLDFYAPNSKGAADKFFINDGTGKFTDESATRLPGVSSHSGGARFGDVDNDGDLDLFVGDGLSGGSGIAHLYLNDGTGKFTESAVALPTTSQGNEPFDLDLIDMDGDFDLDLFIDMHSGKGSLWQNDGTGKFTDMPGNLPAQSGLKYGPVTCDVDGDGDLDLWQDNSGPNYTEQLLINDGTGKFTDETAARVTGNPGADDNGLACIDFDGDGDLDAAIMALGTAERILKNDGTGHFTLEANAFPNIVDSTLGFDWGDLNGDGKLDVVTGQGESGSFVERVYIGTDASVVDVVPPKIRAVETLGSVGPGEAPVFRYGISDNATTDTGPRLQKAYLKITEPSASEVPAAFMGGDLFRAVLPGQAGGTTVTFQACALDRQGNEGCSTTLSYTVTGVGPGSGGGGTGGEGGSGAAGGSGGQGGSGAAGGQGGSGAAGGSGGQGGSGASGGQGGNGASGGQGGGTGGDFTLEDPGCGCGVPGADPKSGPLGLGLLGALAAWARRRRDRSR